MEFQTLKRSHLKRNIIIGVVVVAIISAVILNFTRAKYRVTQSIPIVNGTINYTPYDFKMIAMYQANDSGKYIEIDKMPSSDYIINEEKSYCEVNGEKDENAKLYTNSYQEHVIANLQKGAKCYLYFDEQPLVGDTLLAYYPTKLIRSNFSSTITDTTTGTIYYADTSKGRTYYFAGNPSDNWVKFAGFYWRIIRINEDGSLRLMYQGTSANITGNGTQITISGFNPSYGNNAYVGFMYTVGNVHGTGANSTIKNILDNWYIVSTLLGYASRIDGNAGFCGDREPSTISSSSNGSGGTGTTQTYYGGYIRSITNKVPTFECENESDLYTTKESSQGNKVLDNPIGLISMDEVAYAGGVYGIENQRYYLYTNQNYWTMSPSYFASSNNWTYMFSVSFNGNIGYLEVTNTIGVRPVINLKSNVTISSGSGTSSNPYVIE